MLFELICRLFGEDNWRVAESQHLGMRFNASMSNIQVLIVEDLWTTERMETYNRVKTLITSRAMSIEEKNVAMFDARTPDFILASSNHSTPITMEENDQRSVSTSPQWSRRSQIIMMHSMLPFTEMPARS